jgi:hypothetical protein
MVQNYSLRIVVAQLRLTCCEVQAAGFAVADGNQK